MTTEPGDDDLLRGLRAGDEAAFTAFYRRWQGRLFRFALRMCGKAAAAEDVTHEVFMALIAGGNRFDPAKGPLAPYLYGMARNQVRRRLAHDGPGAFATDPPEAWAPPHEGPLERLARAEDAEAVRRAVLALPEHYREAVVLCDLEQLSYEDAAAVLDCAVGTVRSRLHRARAQLAERLHARRKAAAGGAR
jgi:RNA polymerase sigma-70 factor (ECF subfamily)